MKSFDHSYKCELCFPNGSEPDKIKNVKYPQKFLIGSESVLLTEGGFKFFFHP